MYVETIKSKRGNKIYLTTLIRESYRQGGKVKHRTLSNISKLPQNLIDQIKNIIKNKDVCIQGCSQQIQIQESREYGASYTVWCVAKSLGLDDLIYSRREQWRNDAMAMIVGRVVYQGSKLSLTNLYADSALWEIAGHNPGTRPDVDKHCYEVMDRLLKRQESIEKALVQRHIKRGVILLYDITSSYMEGEYESSELVTFGKDRDSKREHEQIVIGLMTDVEGRPVSIKVFKGNASDQTTVLGQVQRLCNKFGVREVIFAGDRGMLTPKRISEVNEAGFRTLTALTHPQIMKLLERSEIHLWWKSNPDRVI